MSSASELDANDPLASFRDRFAITDPGTIYLDGNSLGRMPKAAASAIKDAVDRQWGDRLIQSWGEGWYDLPQRLGGKIARLIGAQPQEVLCCDSTSVNFYKLAHSVLSNRGRGRNKVVTDSQNFPSDLYLLQGLITQFPGVEVVVAEDPMAYLYEDVALLTLSHVAFKSGFRYDMQSVTEAAHQKGIPVLWDLSHSAGAIPIDLGACDVDYAVGCTYKYLNGGPGSPAFLYIREDLQEQSTSPIWGWFGQKKPFDFNLDYTPADGLNRMLAGTPPVLSMIGIKAGVDLLLEAGMDQVWAKAQRMVEFAYDLWKSELEPVGVGWGSPQPSQSHGSHVTFTHPDAYAIDQALIQRHQVIPDFRPPDGIRFGFAPLYTTFAEIERGIQALKSVVETGEFKEFGERTAEVT